MGIIKNKPASFPKTSVAETNSRNILLGLIHTEFIKTDLKVLDKNPNSDGIIEINDEYQFPIGKIEVQLKTLRVKDYFKPKYSCELSLLSYAENSLLPVLLIAVNQKSKKAFWRHLDKELLKEASNSENNKSFTVLFPTENCIDGISTIYIKQWIKLITDAQTKLFDYDSLIEQMKLLEEKVSQLQANSTDDLNLPVETVKYLHEFIDTYNYILDKEFKTIKTILYPNFWKVGIGIIAYNNAITKFVLYPIEFTQSQLLVKRIILTPNTDIFRDMSEGKVLIMVTLPSDESLKYNPSKYAYGLLESKIMSKVGKVNLPIENEFLAHEYLISFIDAFNGYLGLIGQAESYSLTDLKIILTYVLPKLIATSYPFADWVQEYNHNIDSDIYHTYSKHRSHLIAEEIKKNGVKYSSKVQVKITSQLYNINLIYYYINFLENNNYKITTRPYKNYRSNIRFPNVLNKKTWNKELIWESVKILLNQFYNIYEQYIDTYFPVIKDSLITVWERDSTIIYILMFDEIKGKYLEIYFLKTPSSVLKKVFFFLEEDPNNPIDRHDLLMKDIFTCTLNNQKYDIERVHAQPLDFMFDFSPIYSLINTKIIERLKAFFATKKKVNFSL